MNFDVHNYAILQKIMRGEMFVNISSVQNLISVAVKKRKLCIVCRTFTGQI